MNYSQLLWDCWAFGTSYLPLCGLPTWAAAILPQLGSGEIICMGTRRFRVLQKLGEGGYAVVHLVSQLPTPEHPHPDPELRALKKVLVHSSEHFNAVQQEMLVHSAVQHHPNILPLLDYCCSEAGGSPIASYASAAPPSLTPPVPPVLTHSGTAPTAAAAAAGSFAVPMPAPVSRGGGSGGGLPLAHLSGGPGAGLQSQGQSQGPSQGPGRVACFLFPVFRDGTLAAELDRLAAGGQLLGSADVLSVFMQLAKATAHIHAHGYAHRDIKPLNVLIVINPDHPAARRQQRQGQGQRPGGRMGIPGSRPLGRAARAPEAADVEAGEALTAGRRYGTGPADGLDAGPRYRCVLMDFGSARPRAVQVASRTQALQLQEDAEAHCSAPYRAPELFDVPSPAPLDLAAADVWALGASLFHLMYGEPPFHKAMNASGGSLALAVINCAIGWPRPPAPAYPPELHQMVTAAMAAEPAARPTAAQLAEMAEALAQRGLRDPAPQAASGAASAAVHKG